MAASDLVLVLAICVLSAISMGTSVFWASRQSSISQVVFVALIIAFGCYAGLLVLYSGLAAVSFDGLCYPLLQAPRRCSMVEHIQHVLALIAVGTSPLVVAFFAMATVAGWLTLRFRRRKGAIIEHKT